MTLKQRETIIKLKEEIDKLRKRKKKIVRTYKRIILGFKENLIFEYINCWADLYKDKNKDLAFIDGKRTEWANGYKTACNDIHNELEQLKYTKEEKNGKK